MPPATLLVPLMLAWFGRHLTLRGEGYDNSRFTYRCRAKGCGWYSPVYAIEQRHLRQPCHPHAGLEEIEIVVLVCADCSTAYVYPAHGSGSRPQHKRRGEHKPPPLPLRAW